MTSKPALQQISLPYPSDSADLFEKIRALPGAIFLDSAHPLAQGGRYDILVALPYIEIESSSTQTRVQRNQVLTIHTEPPFDLLNRLFSEECTRLARDELKALPFSGGMIGCFSYELNHAAILKITKTTTLPLLQLGFYDTFIVVDHHTKSCTAYAVQTREDDPLAQILTCLQHDNTLQQNTFQLHASFTKRSSAKKYADDFNSIQNFLQSGDCYQINYTQRFDSHYSGDPWLAYRLLRQKSPAPFSAYFTSKHGAILSHSPEQFLHVQGGLISSKPIKGTRARRTHPNEDEAQKTALINSAKDRAENVMIVDLLRNDIGRTAKTGSVQVPELCKVESYANVHHLVSTITAQLADGHTLIDLFRDCFPGGSITGAPKKRAMEIIETLEPVERGVYCGSIAYFDFNGHLDSNITIRTLLCHEGEIYCWGGGGIVADSNESDEYQESIDKVSNLLETLEQTCQSE